MNASAHPPFFAALRPAARRSRHAFALIVTLLILSLLVIVAVSYLSSMVSERQTADAYTSKARAEQVAQAGVDSAMAILTESFRDFPDSATAWDPHQSTNNGRSTGDNEGTDLYLRAVPMQAQLPGAATGTTATVANPVPNGAAAANDLNGNNPNNPACNTFVLPLISGVPAGRAQKVANGVAMLPTPMNVSEPDPTKQNFADLNVRRSSGDTQGVIGSPPDWTTTTPKPARAYWVNLKDNSGRTTGRYAFWIEDESFRANISAIGTPAQKAGSGRIDNALQPVDGSSPPLPRALRPADVSLPGFLNAIKSLAADSAVKALAPDTTATELLNTRAAYPSGFFPDPLAFKHSATSADGTVSTDVQPIVDALRYTTTTQSGALNFTRHGTQRLNLNGILPKQTASPETPLPRSDIQSGVDQIVETLKFHLPNFGQRFYRTSTATDSGTLNATQVAANNPGSDHSTIYLYKVAANICDYLDTDSQPTMIVSGGTVDSQIKPPLKAPLTEDDDGSSNHYWAQGKESSPLIQEVAVRYRPVVATNAGPIGKTPRDFDLQVDYYIEFWNMTDRDIYATQQPSDAKLPHLNGASIYVRDQQGWSSYPAGDVFVPDATHQNTEQLPSNGDPPANWEISLSTGVTSYKASGTSITPVPQPSGVVFRAGAVTIVTTDPDCFKTGYPYTYKEGKTPGNPSPPAYSGPSAYPANVFYCPLLAGQREYWGHVQKTGGLPDTQGGMMLGGGFTSPSVYPGTEIDLVNQYGYLEHLRGAITKTNGPGANYETNTYKFIGTAGSYNDYSFGGGLIGNVAESPLPLSTNNTIQSITPSELGDPRTNNEQLSINIAANTSDGSHFMPGTRTLGIPNWVTVKPDQTTAAAIPWGDYYSMPASNANPDATNAPAVVGDGPLTSIGQLGDVFDPARIQGTGGIQYSRGGGRTFKLGQHDDRYTFDPAGSPAGSNTSDYVSASTSWASWRLADVFSIDGNQELPGRININGVLRDKGAALLAALDGWNFQPATASGVTSSTTDPTIHGDGHGTSGLAGTSLDTTITATATTAQHGAAQIVSQIISRLNPASTATAATPHGPFFERGEFGELGTGTVPIFGVNDSTTPNTALVSSVDMNKTFDHGREEMFRRLAELICTRGDTFTVYTVGQSIFQAPINNAAQPPPLKVTATHRQRVTFRLVPHYATALPTFNNNSSIASQVAARFARPDRYDAQVLEVNTF